MIRREEPELEELPPLYELAPAWHNFRWQLSVEDL